MRVRAEVTQAFQYGLIIFTLTALLGLANATQIFGALDRNTLLTHLHSGTLGWITMGVIGIAIWIFARGDDDLAAPVMLSALSTAAYVMAFWSGVYILRGVFGLSELAVIVYWWWFVYTRAGGWAGIRRLDIPKLSVVLGLTTLVVGSTLGVTVQVLLATGNVLPTSFDLIGAHATAQTGGYLVLVAAGFAEWQLAGAAGKRSTLGLAQGYLLLVRGSGHGRTMSSSGASTSAPRRSSRCCSSWARARARSHSRTRSRSSPRSWVCPHCSGSPPTSCA